MSEPVLSVVIPTLNEEKYLDSCLRRLSSDLAGKKHEIIIVDGNSTDLTLQIAKKYSARIIRNKMTIGAARQAGLQSARSPVVAFTDADSKPLKGWSDTAIGAVSKPGVVMAFGPMKLSEPVLFKSFIEALYNLPVALLSVLGMSNVAGFNLVVSKKAALQAGGFNPAFSVLEDVDLAKRIRSYGKIVYAPGMVVETSARRFKSLSGVSSYFTGWLQYLLKGSTQGIKHEQVR